MLALVPRCDLGHVGRRLPAPHTSPTWDWVLSGPVPTMSFTPTHTGVTPDRGRRAQGRRPRVGDLVPGRPCCSHATGPREGLLVSRPQGAHQLNERGAPGCTGPVPFWRGGFTCSFVRGGPASPTRHSRLPASQDRAEGCPSAPSRPVTPALPEAPIPAL